MILPIHIIAALGGLLWSTAALVAPSRSKIQATYCLTLLTIASGTYLVITQHSSILHGCLTGLVYTGFTTSGALAGSYRLARASAKF